MAAHMAEDRLGWVSPSSTRGSYAILTISFFTIFFCTYTCLHFDIPRSRYSTWHSLGRKILYSVGALLAPDLMASYAFFDHLEARGLTQWFQDRGLDQWTNVHSYFFLMGGFKYELPQKKNRHSKIRTENSDTLDQDNVAGVLADPDFDLTAVSEDQVWAMGKTDWLVQTLTALQAIYLFAQISARLQQGLEVTCLEVVSAAYVPLTLLSFCLWWNKVRCRSQPVHRLNAPPCPGIPCHSIRIRFQSYQD